MGDPVSEGRVDVSRGRPPREWNTPYVVARMGKDSDETLGAELGLSVHTIRAERVRRGIHMQAHVQQQAYDTLLGLIPDAEVARLKNVTRQAVSLRRARLNIPACSDTSPLALLLLEVRERGQESEAGVSIPTDLYERICDLLSR